jgi:hypothetical protein
VLSLASDVATFGVADVSVASVEAAEVSEVVSPGLVLAASVSLGAADDVAMVSLLDSSSSPQAAAPVKAAIRMAAVKAFFTMVSFDRRRPLPGVPFDQTALPRQNAEALGQQATLHRSGEPDVDSRHADQLTQSFGFGSDAFTRFGGTSASS